MTVDLGVVGLDGPWPALLADLRATSGAPADALHGRVVRGDRGAATVLTERGPARCTWPPTAVPPVTGDWVLVSAGLDGADETHLLHAIAPRRTEITRPTVHGQRSSVEPDQVLAANVDLVGVVVPVDDDVNVRRLERGLVMAWESGATPVALLTKVDLCEDVDRARTLVAAAAIGVDLVAVSPMTDEGVAEVRDLVAAAGTLVLLGASGSGKSTLTNALAGEEVLAVGDVRAVDGKGRHTTTHRELIPLPTGGAVLDTPGLRTLGLAEVTDGLAAVFPEIEELARRCRFRDCRHEQEPGCAVLAALDSSELHHDRYEGWSRIRASSESAALRADVAGYRAATRSMGKMYRRVLDEKARMRGDDD